MKTINSRLFELDLFTMMNTKGVEIGQGARFRVNGEVIENIFDISFNTVNKDGCDEKRVIAIKDSGRYPHFVSFLSRCGDIIRGFRNEGFKPVIFIGYEESSEEIFS